MTEAITKNKILKNECLSTQDKDDDIYDYISSLFSMDDASIRENKLNPLGRIYGLKVAEEKVFEKIKTELLEADEEVKTSFNNSIELIKRNYLFQIIGDLLDVKENLLQEEENKEKALSCILKEIGYLDSF